VGLTGKEKRRLLKGKRDSLCFHRKKGKRGNSQGREKIARSASVKEKTYKRDVTQE